MQKALDGVRVLDLTNVLAGPLCAYQLALMGAEVIKVEMPGSGDLARQLGNDPELNRRMMGASFLAQNSGKKSVTVNLKTEAGKAVLLQLVRSADVLVENFRPGVMNRLGVGYDRLSADNARLIYCAVTGFGQSGPLKDAPAYDQIIQGLSGMMSVTGNAASGPLRAGYPVTDTFSGMVGAFAIVCALLQRNASGRGTFIDVSMLDSALVAMGWVVSNYLIAGTRPQAQGNDNFTAAPSGAFRASDGLLNISANKQEQFEALAYAIDRKDLISDVRFAEREARKRNREALTAEIEASLATRTALEWEALLSKAGVPAGRVLDVAAVLASEQIAARDLLQTFDDESDVGRPFSVLKTGFRFDAAGPSADAPPPSLGEHTDEVLTALGYSAEELAELRSEGAI
jgi:CoA:oxalate CoA-transferase